MIDPTAPASVTAVFLFTDLVGSTGWKRDLGDRDYLASLRLPHDRLFRELMAEFPGTVERDNAGDGFLATFATPSEAVKFALRFHAALAGFDWAEPVRRTGRVPTSRVGIHTGEVVEFEDASGKKVSGQAVDLAARVMGLGCGQQTLLTRAAFDSARQHVRQERLEWPAHGRYRFAGKDEDPLEVFEVGVPGVAPLVPPPDGEKAKRVVIDPADDTGSWRPAVGLDIPGRDGWLLDRQLGEGGFGEVWLAHQKRTKESRVFKFCFDADRLRSFKREITFFKLIKNELGSRSDFARLYDVQVEKAPYFLESEHVPAGNLGQWLESKGGFADWPLADRLRFLAGVARAVASAHSLGIIHKDLKPSNVLVQESADGRPQPVLADFGIGVLADRSVLAKAQVTETGFDQSVLGGNDSSRTGTRLYSPPESQLGKSATTGTDVYALGVMLFQLAAGDWHRPLGTGWSDAIATGDPDRDALLVQDITSATFADPSRRLSTAAELADRLERLEARSAEAKRASETAERERQTAEQSKKLRFARKVAAASLAAVVAFGVIAAVAWWQWEEAKKEAKRADEKTELAEKFKVIAEDETAAARTNAEKFKHLLNVSLLREAQSAWDSNRCKDAREVLESLSPEDRCIAWGLHARRLHSELFELKRHTGEVLSVAFSPDGGRIVTGSGDGTARVWDAKTGQSQLILKGHSWVVWSVAFSPDGDQIVTGSGDYTARVWDAKTGQSQFELKGHTGPVLSVALSPVGGRIVTGSLDKTARVWDAKTGQSQLILKGHSGEVMSIAFSPDGGRIVTGSNDKTARIWDAKTGQPQLELKGHTEGVDSVAFSPDGSRIVTGSIEGTARVWDAKTGQSQLELKGHTDRVTCVAFNPDGSRIVTGSIEGTARVWDAKTGQSQLELKGHTGWVWSVAFSPDGGRIVTGSRDYTARVWDAKTGQSQLELKGHTAPVLSVAFSPEGSRIVTGTFDRSIRIWDAKTGQSLLELKGHTDRVTSVAFDPEGGRIVTGSGDKSARVWDAKTGQSQLELKGHTQLVSSVAFSPDGGLIVTGSGDQTARVWDAKTGQSQLELKGHTRWVTSVAFSPDGGGIVTGSQDKTARVWEAKTGQSQLELKGHTDVVSSVAFSPDGGRIVTGSFDKTARVWDARTGQSLLELKGHTAYVTSVAFSPDGGRVVTGSFDRSIRIWDAKTGQSLLELKVHTGLVTSVAFSPDGGRIVTGTDDNTTRVWDARPRSSITEIDELVYLRGLTRPQPESHAEFRKQFESEKNAFAASVQHSLEYRAKGILAAEAFDHQAALGHFLTAELLRPKPGEKPKEK